MSNRFRLLVLCMALMGVTSAYAQTQLALEDARLECRYFYTQVADTTTYRSVQDTMTLLIGKDHSLFYTEKLAFHDSICSLPGGEQQFRELSVQAVRQGQKILPISGDYLYHDLKNGGFTTRTQLNREFIEYAEEAEMIPWQFTDSVKTVLGFECHQAEADFRGRHWIAWYTLEVPVSQGPWKLCGLPGLICEAYDARRHYVYTLTALVPDPGREIIFYNWTKNYKKTTRIEFLRTRLRNHEQQNDQLRGSSVLSAFARKKMNDYHERDYR